MRLPSFCFLLCSTSGIVVRQSRSFRVSIDLRRQLIGCVIGPCGSTIGRDLRSSISHRVKRVRDAFAVREGRRGCSSNRIIDASISSGAVGQQGAIADGVVAERHPGAKKSDRNYCRSWEFRMFFYCDFS